MMQTEGPGAKPHVAVRSLSRATPAAIVIGCSAGGLETLQKILPQLPADYPLPILIVQHLHSSDSGRFAEHLDHYTPLAVVEGEDKAEVRPGYVYIAPANYHMLVEQTGRIALTTDERVNSSRPSIDVLFDSAARVWRERLLCVLLSGASRDGTDGAAVARAFGAQVIVQDPITAVTSMMPESAITAGLATSILPPESIGLHLKQLGEEIGERVRS